MTLPTIDGLTAEQQHAYEAAVAAAGQRGYADATATIRAAAGTMAHDVSNDLTVIMSAASLALWKLGDEHQPVRVLLADICEAAKRGAAKVDVLLNFSAGRASCGIASVAGAGPSQTVEPRG
jgi:hypothetical protein